MYPVSETRRRHLPAQHSAPPPDAIRVLQCSPAQADSVVVALDAPRRHSRVAACPRVAHDARAARHPAPARRRVHRHAVQVVHLGWRKSTRLVSERAPASRSLKTAYFRAVMKRSVIEALDWSGLESGTALTLDSPSLRPNPLPHSLQLTAVQLGCCAHVKPPSVECRMVPAAPTAHPRSAPTNTTSYSVADLRTVQR
jgi:hypothetical protein